jgi:hypothetical protein
MSVTTTEPTAQTGEVPGDSNSGAQGGAPAAQSQAGNDAQDRTFSQQAVNALIGSRLKEARQQWEKDQKDAAETAEAEKRGDYEKALSKERERAAAAERRMEEIERAARERILASEIRSVAVELGFANPSLAHRLVDPAAVTFDEESGEPKNVRALLEKLAKDEPYLVGGQQQNGTAAIPRTPNGTTITRDQFHQQERERALRSGRYSAL